MSLSVASAGTTTASWDLGSASLAVCRSVSLSLSFCLVVLLCLVLSVCLVCLPCLPCLSVCLSLSVCLVRSVCCVCVPTRLSKTSMTFFSSPPFSTPPFSSPRPPHSSHQDTAGAMDDHETWEQPGSCQRLCTLLGVQSSFTKDFIGFTEDFAIPRVLILWVVCCRESLGLKVFARTPWTAALTC